MNASNCLILLAVLCYFGKLISAQGSDDPNGLTMDDNESISTNSTTTVLQANVGKSITKRQTVRRKDLSYPGCGLRSPKIESRQKRSESRRFPFISREKRGLLGNIVGGVNSRENSWPWMVALIKGVKVLQFRCGASLISERYLLTAAHCFDPERRHIDPSKFVLNVGAHTVSSGALYRLKNVLIHPDYKQRQFYNDIAILETRTPIRLSNKVYPVCLPTDRLREKIERENNIVTATGWGDTKFNGNRAYFLKELTLPIVSLKECNDSYITKKSPTIPRGLTTLFLCAGFWEGGKGTCQGDSGGPLVSPLENHADDDETYFLAGVTSFGVKCDEAGFPGVYTRVSQYTQWIYDNTDLGKV